MKTEYAFATLVAALMLAGNSSSLHAANCSVTGGGSVDCRELENTQLGEHYCYAPDAMPVREVLTVERQPNLWETLKDTQHKYNDIELDTLALGTGIPKGQCVKRDGLLLKHKMRVTVSGSGYVVRFTPPAGYTPPDPVDIQMTEGGPPGKKLWLSGQHPTDKNLRYYLFLRDEDPTDTSNKFPKFINAIVIDFNDGTCWLNSPEVDGNIVRVETSKACEEIAEASLVSVSGGTVETGVGGGGEQK